MCLNNASVLNLSGNRELPGLPDRLVRDEPVHPRPRCGADAGIAASWLWPRTTIGTDAVANLPGGEQALARSRTPQIMAAAANAVLTTPAARERASS